MVEDYYKDALRQVLRYAAMLEDAARPIRFDGPVETAVCEARQVTAYDLYRIVGQELGMSDAQLKEFAYSSKIRPEGSDGA